MPVGMGAGMGIYRGRAHSALAAVCVAVSLLMSGGASAQWAPPPQLRAQVEALDAAQAEFITSGDVLAFIPERQLQHELATRDADALARLIDDLMSLAGQMAYDPARDMGAAPLNLASKNFNRSTLPTPAPLRELQREPGPFSVQRYLFPQSGVPTFGGAHVAIWPEDLVAGAVDVAIVGVPSDMSSGRRDAANGPNAMRMMQTIATTDGQSLIEPLEVLSVVDYGDFYVDRLSIERTVEHITAMVAETAATGAMPMLVGGDASILYPGVRGIARARDGNRFGLLQFSAHPDAERAGDHSLSDRQALMLLLDEGIVNGDDVVQVGLRGPAVDVATLQRLRDNGVRYHTMVEVQRNGYDKVMRRVLREVDRGADAYFVAVDVSVIDPGDMVAAGRIASNGIAIDDITRTIRQVCAAKEIVGFEITDLAPMLDLSRLSVLHSNAILNACLSGMAVRKAGLKPDYIHPLALDHGR